MRRRLVAIVSDTPGPSSRRSSETVAGRTADAPPRSAPPPGSWPRSPGSPSEPLKFGDDGSMLSELAQIVGDLPWFWPGFALVLVGSSLLAGATATRLHTGTGIAWLL